MVRYNVLITIILAVPAAVACKKTLDLPPENSLTYRNGLITGEDFEAALRGAAQFLQYETRDNHLLQVIKGEYGDDEQPGPLPERFLFLDFAKEGDWSNHYALIAQCNMILKYLERSAVEGDWKQQFRGEALFYKSLAYFELVRQFGDCVLVLDEIDIRPQAKTSWQSVADYAIAMAEEAASLLRNYDELRNFSNNIPVNKTKPSAGAANALLAHLCAWKAGCNYFAEDGSYDVMSLWRKAEAASSALIESGNYQLAANAGQVVREVLPGNSAESIFESAFRDGWNEMDILLQKFPFVPAIYYQHWPVLLASTPADKALLPIKHVTVSQMFQNKDERKYAYFHEFDEMSKPEHDAVTQGFAYPYKYKDVYINSANHFINFNVNKIWWRLADIILLRAECRARLGVHSAAIEDLNKIRFRAQADFYDPVEHGGDLRYTIFKEREKELLIEGERYYDVIRNGYAATELKGGFRTASQQDFKDGAFFLAIRTTGSPNDFENNPFMVQNKFWSRQ